MKFLRHDRPIPAGAASQTGVSITQSHGSAFHTHLRKQRRMLRLVLFVVGLFLLPLILPSSPVHHAVIAGYGGGSVTSAVQVSQRSTQPAGINPIAALTGLASDGVSSAFQIVLGSVVHSFFQWAYTSFNSIIAAALSFNFVTQTPHALTDGHRVIIHLEAWMLLVMDGLLSLFLVIAGYNVMFGASERVHELFPRLVVAAIVANFSLPILGQFIEANNTLCNSVGAVLASLGIGHLGLDPVGLFNFATAPEYLVIVYLVYLLAAVLLIVQMLLRIALLDLLLVLAPVGILCLALPQTRMWGQMWAQIFVATFITQVLQLLCLAIGAALIGSFGHASLSPVSILVGIAALFLAGKIPDMLLFRVLRLNSSTANDFGGQVGSVVQMGAEMAALIAA